MGSLKSFLHHWGEAILFGSIIAGFIALGFWYSAEIGRLSELEARVEALESGEARP